MELKGLVLMGLAVGLLEEAALAQQTILNLTDATVAGLDPTTVATSAGLISGGFVGGAFFRRPVSADDSNAGSGIFRDLYRLSDSSVSLGDPQEGYNRDDVMDSNVPNGFDPILRVVDLVQDATGTAYVFVIDTNESGSVPGRYLSLDDVRIYLGGPTDPVTLPQSRTGLQGAFGDPVYAMSPDGGSQNHILLDYSLYSGSGQMDLFVFVPQSVFAGASPNDLVYVYTSFGLFSLAAGFGPSAGPEQVSIPGVTVTSPVDPFILRVPEPAIGLIFVTAMLALSLRRSRRARR